MKTPGTSPATSHGNRRRYRPRLRPLVHARRRSRVDWRLILTVGVYYALMLAAGCLVGAIFSGRLWSWS